MQVDDRDAVRMDRVDVQPARYRGIGAPKSVRERLDQVTWLLGYLDDLASDLSAIHGIRDMTQLSGPAFFKLAIRMTAYQCVMRERITALLNDNPPPAGAAPHAGAHGGPARPAAQVPATKEALQADSVMSQGIFSFGSMT